MRKLLLPLMLILTCTSALAKSKYDFTCEWIQSLTPVAYRCENIDSVCYVFDNAMSCLQKSQKLIR